MSTEVIIFTGGGIYLAIMLRIAIPAFGIIALVIALQDRLGTLSLFRRVV